MLNRLGPAPVAIRGRAPLRLGHRAVWRTSLCAGPEPGARPLGKEGPAETWRSVRPAGAWLDGPTLPPTRPRPQVAKGTRDDARYPRSGSWWITACIIARAAHGGLDTPPSSTRLKPGSPTRHPPTNSLAPAKFDKRGLVGLLKGLSSTILWQASFVAPKWGTGGGGCGCVLLFKRGAGRDGSARTG